MGDYIVRATAAGGQVRAFAATTKGLVEEAKERHNMSPKMCIRDSVIGNEGNGVSRLVKDKCDFVASIPMKGDIDSLNASVAAGVLAYEIVRQRLN